MTSLNKKNTDYGYDSAYHERAQAYSAQAKSFHADKYQRAQASAKQWRMVAVLALGFSIAAIGLLYHLFPLKQFVPVYYLKDPITKQMVAQPSSKPPVILEIENRDRNYWINRFVVSRESWNPILKDNRAKLVEIMSSQRVWDHYNSEQGDFSTDSFKTKYGNESMRLVRLHSINHLSKTTANFRMEVRIIKGEEIIKENWQGIAEYRWRPKHIISEKDQLENPYGFTVIRYETSKEMLNNPSKP